MQDHPNTKPFILLVEDNHIALHLLEGIVNIAGCQYITATNGEQALDLAKTTSFDLIITDIGLPGISGNELTRHIRNWEKETNKNPTPIIGVTAQSQKELKETGFFFGMNEVLMKPLDITTINAMIEKYYKTSIKKPPSNLTAIETKKTLPLGPDLPDEEHQLFELDQFPLLDINSATQKIGHESLLLELLKLMLDNAIPDDEAAMIKAYESKNWALIEKIAHKIKGGAIYCGTTRLQYACQYLERYRKAGHSEALEELYQQLIRVIAETKQNIQLWLNKKI